MTVYINVTNIKKTGKNTLRVYKWFKVKTTNDKTKLSLNLSSKYIKSRKSSNELQNRKDFVHNIDIFTINASIVKRNIRFHIK